MLTRSKMSAESLQTIYQILNDLKEDLKNKATIKNIVELVAEIKEEDKKIAELKRNCGNPSECSE